ncbi:MAG: phosphoribosylformylglycinamidine synthase subunit PurQ [Nannocystaceae bacterium]
MDSKTIRGTFGDLSPVLTREVRVLVITGYGLNCEAETATAFALLGVRVDQVHLADLLERGRRALDGYHMVAFIGGFSFGDHVASGRVLANRLRGRLGDALAAFVDCGGLGLGMCNGFQVMVKLGLLPALERARGRPLAAQTVSLVHNDRFGYYDAWVRLRIDPASPCVFTRGIAFLELPCRHAEGKLVFDPSVVEEVAKAHLVPLQYVGTEGKPTQIWPDNPNGSGGAAAGLCDRSGRVFGLMPHPEAYLYPENHPRWIEQRDEARLPAVGQGLHLFANGVRAVLAS